MLDYIANVTYDDRGRTDEITTPAGSRSFTYHASTHRLYQDSFASPYYSLSRSYDLYDEIGNVVTVSGSASDPNDPGVGAFFAYDERNRLESWDDASGTQHFYSYDVLGNLIGKELANPGDPQNQQYNHTTKPHAITAREPGSVTYDYDQDGNVREILGGTGSRYLTFDWASRLTAVGTAPGGSDVLSVGYNADGRRIGEATASESRTFLGDLWEFESTSRFSTIYIFAFGERIAFKRQEIPCVLCRSAPVLPLPPEVLLYLGGLFALGIALLWSGGLAGAGRRPGYATLSAALVLLIAIPPGVWAGPPPVDPPVRRWIFADRLGSGVLVMDEDGYRVARRVFKPFGGVHEEHALEEPAEIFAGHPLQEETGLYYMQARWQEPASGRFLSVDPVIRDLWDPQSHNAYSYVENNPVNRIDPTGEIGACIYFGSQYAGGGICLYAAPDFSWPISFGWPADLEDLWGTGIVPYNPNARLPSRGVVVGGSVLGSPGWPGASGGFGLAQAAGVAIGCAATGGVGCAVAVAVGAVGLVALWVTMGGPEAILATGDLMKRLPPDQEDVDEEDAEDEAGQQREFGPEDAPSPPADPSQPPGEGWEWRGKGPPGSREGSWYNPKTGESLHPDLGHSDPIGPHWDWKDPSGVLWRIFPGGKVVPK